MGKKACGTALTPVSAAGPDPSLCRPVLPLLRHAAVAHPQSGCPVGHSGSHPRGDGVVPAQHSGCPVAVHDDGACPVKRGPPDYGVVAGGDSGDHAWSIPDRHPVRGTANRARRRIRPMVGLGPGARRIRVAPRVDGMAQLHRRESIGNTSTKMNAQG